MAASLHERIAAAVKTALLDHVTGIGSRVYRGRQDGFTIEECDAIDVSAGDNQTTPFSDQLDDNRFEITVTVYVRDRDWETKADGYVAEIHRLVIAYGWTAAGIKLASIRLGDQSWSADGGSNTPGKRALTFVFRVLTDADDMSVQP